MTDLKAAAPPPFVAHKACSREKKAFGNALFSFQEGNPGYLPIGSCTFEQYFNEDPKARQAILSHGEASLKFCARSSIRKSAQLEIALHAIEVPCYKGFSISSRTTPSNLTQAQIASVFGTRVRSYSAVLLVLPPPLMPIETKPIVLSAEFTPGLMPWPGVALLGPRAARKGAFDITRMPEFWRQARDSQSGLRMMLVILERLRGSSTDGGEGGSHLIFPTQPSHMDTKWRCTRHTFKVPAGISLNGPTHEYFMKNFRIMEQTLLKTVPAYKSLYDSLKASSEKKAEEEVRGKKKKKVKKTKKPVPPPLTTTQPLAAAAAAAVEGKAVAEDDDAVDDNELLKRLGKLHVSLLDPNVPLGLPHKSGKSMVIIPAPAAETKRQQQEEYYSDEEDEEEDAYDKEDWPALEIVSSTRITTTPPPPAEQQEEEKKKEDSSSWFLPKDLMWFLDLTAGDTLPDCKPQSCAQPPPPFMLWASQGVAAMKWGVCRV